jgi:hypothetical protein
LDPAKHAYSIEMKSRDNIKRISISENSRDPIIFEGELGDIEGLSLIEGQMLEVRGVNGILRIDMTEEEFKHYCNPDSCSSCVESSEKVR